MAVATVRMFCSSKADGESDGKDNVVSTVTLKEAVIMPALLWC